MGKVCKLYRSVSRPVEGTRWRFYGEVRCDAPAFNTLEVTEEDDDVTCPRCLKLIKETHNDRDH